MELGQVVLSRCGRDKGRYFIVVSFDESKNFVFISDGDVRKVEKPKKKKLKHVIPLHTDKLLNSKLVNGIRITNPEIKKHIRTIIEQDSDINLGRSISDKEGG